MHIEAVCPYCQTTVRVNPELRGQQLRCVNSSCRRVFTVEEKAPAPQPANQRRSARIDRGPLPGEGAGQQSGSVGDLVPILPTEPVVPEPVREEAPTPSSNHVEDLVPLVEAEFADAGEPEVVAEFADTDGAPPAPEAPEAAPSWREPPPVRRGQPGAAPTHAFGGRPSVEEAPAEAPDGPVEMAPGTWEAPPVRHPDALEEAPAEGAHGEPYHYDEPAHPRRRRRWSCVAALLLVLLVPAGLGVGGYFVYTVYLHNEADMAAKADAEYKEGKFRAAADSFQGLVTGFPSS